ncbi:hypothetical protein BH11PLA2_BH11PLA2_52810 [soil metagenome]
MFTILALALFAAPPTITAAVGTGERGFIDGRLPQETNLDNPFDVTFGDFGELVFSDTNNHCVRYLNKHGFGIGGTIQLLAGSGTKGYTGDGGPARKATLNEPYGIAFETTKHPAIMGDLYIVDRLNYCIRKVERSTGIITTIAGTGKSGTSKDGIKATEAALGEANGICISNGILYIADVKAQKVRSVDLKTNIIGTLVGTGEKTTLDGPLDKAACNGPRALCTDHDGTILLAEREGNCVRRIDPVKKTITRIAGTGKKGYTGDGGPASDCTFDGPKAICVDKDSNIFVCDTENEVIRKIDIKTGVVTTVAGKGKTKTPGLGDGDDPLKATLGRPHGVAVGPDGAIYIGDTLSHRIRVVK